MTRLASVGRNPGPASVRLVVGGAEDVVGGFPHHGQDGLGALQQSGSKNRVRQVRPGLLQRSDRIMLRHLAPAQTGQLRKDKPHPMRAFQAVAEFPDRLLVHVGLSIKKPLKVGWVG